MRKDIMRITEGSLEEEEEKWGTWKSVPETAQGGRAKKYATSDHFFAFPKMDITSPYLG